MSSSTRRQAAVRLSRLNGVRPEFKEHILNVAESLPLRVGPNGYQITDRAFNKLMADLRSTRAHWFSDLPVIARVPAEFSLGDTVTLTAETWQNIPPAERLRLTYNAEISHSADKQTVKIVPKRKAS